MGINEWIYKVTVIACWIAGIAFGLYLFQVGAVITAGLMSSGLGTIVLAIILYKVVMALTDGKEPKNGKK